MVHFTTDFWLPAALSFFQKSLWSSMQKLLQGPQISDRKCKILMEIGYI